MKNRFTPFFVGALSVGAVALLCQNAQSQSLVYDDTGAYQGANFNFDPGGAGTYSAGNEIILAGSTLAAPVEITQFQVQIDFTGTGTPTGSVDVAFYNNTGTPYNGYATPAATPFYDLGSTALTSFSAGEVLTYSVPDITAFNPDFTFVVSFSGLTATETAGLAIYGAASVGQNYNDAWVNTGSWALQEAGSGQPAPLFGVSVSAIPEPSTIALGVMGACGFLARRRKS